MEFKEKHIDVIYDISKSKEIEIDGETKEVFPFVLTSERIDRDGDIVVQSELDIKGYQANGVVFFDHDTNKHAIGNAYNVRKSGKKILADIWFHELDEESKQIKRYVKAGVYKAGSIGFRVYDSRKRAVTQSEAKNTHFKYINELAPTELYEFSVVKIPSNVDATAIKKYKDMYKAEMEAKEKGILNKTDNLMENIIEKAGATLNKANKKKLTDADELMDKAKGFIKDVLASAGSEEPEKDIATELQEQLNAKDKTIEELELKIKELTPKKVKLQEYNQLNRESVNG